MKKQVLVIDDDPSILESLEFLLVEEGYDVVTAQNGSAIRQIHKTIDPNLILLDYWLPVANGDEVTRELKGNESTRNIPVIVMSASYNIGDRVRAAGADDFIPKPYDLEQMLSKVGNYLVA